MKTILALTAIGVLATPAFAGKHRPAPTKAKKAAVAAPAKKSGLAAPLPTIDDERDIVLVADIEGPKKLGDSFELKTSRASARPDVDEESFELKTVSNKEAVAVVKTKADELEYCWIKLPAKQRVETSAVLHLAIEATGTVAGVWIDGTVPAAVEKCMTDRAMKWSFPVADAGCEVEHGISFSLLESKGK